MEKVKTEEKKRQSKKKLYTEPSYEKKSGLYKNTGWTSTYYYYYYWW